MRKLVCGLLLIIPSLGFTKSLNPSFQGRIFEIQKHDRNRVEFVISNFGKFGQTNDYRWGCKWPIGSNHVYIYGAGLCFGAIDPESGDTLFTFGYNLHNGQSEYGPGLKGMPINDPGAIIYMSTQNFPPDQSKFPMAPSVSRSNQDSWCCYNDCDSNLQLPGSGRPIGLEVYQTGYVWNYQQVENMVYLTYQIKNVSGHNLHDCYVGFSVDPDVGCDYTDDIMAGIVGRWYKYGAADSLWADNLTYIWSEHQEPGPPPWWPGTIGFDLIQTPYDLVTSADKDHDSIPDQYEMDSAYYVTNLPPAKWDADYDGVPDWRDPPQIPQHGMTALKQVTGAPGAGMDPSNDCEYYLTMAGYNFKTGAYEPYDTFPRLPDDQVFMNASGPFDLLADEMTTVVFMIVLADWHGFYGRPDSALVRADCSGQSVCDHHWFLPGPPSSPVLTCVPGDKQMTLIWNNASETEPDKYYRVVSNPGSPLYDPYYQQFDFQGFRIWRSQTGRPGDWTLLGFHDRADGVTFTVSDPYLPESLWIQATDNGIVHSYVDHDVRNGFAYYYFVTAFDRNYIKGKYDSVFIDTFYVDTLTHDTTWDYDSIQVVGGLPLTFESSRPEAVTAVPRREAANYIPAGIPTDSTVFGEPRLDTLVTAVATNPMDIDPNQPLYVEMEKPEYYIWAETGTNHVMKQYAGAVYRVMLKNGAGVIVDSVRSAVKIGTGYESYEFAACKGISVTCDLGTPLFSAAAVNLFEDVLVPAGGYPETLLVPEVLSPVPNFENSPNYAQGFWAYRGHDYTVTWHVAGGKSRTATVIDCFTADTIPFYAFKNDTVTAPNGACWCFNRSATLSGPFPIMGSDTLEYRGSPGTRTKSLYIMGGMINLKKGIGIDSLILPQDGEVWTVTANKDYLPPSVCGRIIIRGYPGYFGTAPIPLNVKVVPNPYIVDNEWQRSSLIRRVRFINLPNQCTIRIFNLNGELVKTLLHAETTAEGKGVVNNAGGDEWWDLLSASRNLVASGVYIFNVESKVGEQTGKFAIVR
jgi:hypothetical protein